MELQQWHEGACGSLVQTWIKLFGDKDVLAIEQAAEAIYRIGIRYDDHVGRWVGFLAEAMQYWSKGGIDGYLADLDDQDDQEARLPDSCYDSTDIRQRIAVVQAELLLVQQEIQNEQKETVG